MASAPADGVGPRNDAAGRQGYLVIVFLDELTRAADNQMAMLRLLGENVRRVAAALLAGATSYLCASNAVGEPRQTGTSRWRTACGTASSR
jgi:hypothetical protein